MAWKKLLILPLRNLIFYFLISLCPIPEYGLLLTSELKIKIKDKIWVAYQNFISKCEVLNA